MLTKVISGGQIGADIAALRAARACGLETGGHATKGWRTLEGSNPGLAEYGLVEHDSPKYPPRTYMNVWSSDATLRIARNFGTAGERCTMRAIMDYGKPHGDVPIMEGNVILVSPRTVALWIDDKEFTILNVAGNARKEIEEPVQAFLEQVFMLLQSSQGI